jgi:subtilisin family serine protease
MNVSWRIQTDVTEEKRLEMSAAKKFSAPLALLTITLTLSSCNTTTPPAVTPDKARADSLEYEYATDVQITPSDTPTALEAQYGGRVVVFQPEAGYAVLGFDGQNAKPMAAGKKLSLERNKGAFMGGGQLAWMGGSVTAWAGGSVTAWAGGSVTAWAGGVFTTVPANTAKWSQIRLEQGQRLASRLGAGVKVAVLDTGIDLNHRAFTNSISRTDMWDFVGNDAVPQEEGTFGVGAFGHGTNVAGIILQIAPRAQILPLRVLGPDGSGDVTRIAAAINYAVSKGAQVINMSLGSENKSSAVQSAIKAATDKGVWVISSSGNTGDQNVTFPASEAYVDKSTAGQYSLSVGSVNSLDLKSNFSTYGTEKKPLEIVAPGESVFAPAPGNMMAAWSGTSMAAPMASGAMALALGQTLKVNRAVLLDNLRTSAADIYNNGMNTLYKDLLGKGRLNVEQFLLNSISR